VRSVGLEFLAEGVEAPYLAFAVQREYTLNFALNGSHREEWGASPLFCWAGWRCIADRYGRSLCLDLDKIREAAERGGAFGRPGNR